MILYSVSTKVAAMNDLNDRLHRAIWNKSSVDIINKLIDEGADIEHRGYFCETPLFAAISYYNPLVIQALLDRGANVEARDLDGNTALHQASSFSYLKIVQLLVEKANVSTINNRGETALHCAAGHGGPNIEVIQVLVKGGFAVNAEDNEGMTPLHTVVYERGKHCTNAPEEKDNVICLLCLGAHHEIKDKKGKKPYWYVSGKEPSFYQKKHLAQILKNSKSVRKVVFPYALKKLNGKTIKNEWDNLKKEPDEKNIRPYAQYDLK